MNNWITYYNINQSIYQIYQLPNIFITIWISTIWQFCSEKLVDKCSDLTTATFYKVLCFGWVVVVCAQTPVSGRFELLASLSIFHYKKVIYLSFWSPVPEDVWRWVWLGQTGELDGLTQRACLGSWYRHMARTIWQSGKHHFVIEHRSQITNWRHNKLDVFLWQGRWWIGGMQAITEGAFKCQV